MFLFKALDYSDDEQEALAKRKLKEQRREENAEAGKTYSSKQNLLHGFQHALGFMMYLFSYRRR